MPRETIVLLGVNHKTAPVQIREQLAFGGYEQPLALLRQAKGINEYHLLSTCNRVEVLFTCTDPDATSSEILDLLFGTRIRPDILSRYIYRYEQEEAVRHLFSVASSLDSMIIGEAQILGQLKEAFRYASQEKSSGLILNKLLHKSFSVAKRVRTETRIGANAVSISYAAVELARKIFGNLGDKRVMLVGAGEMAELAAEHLVGQGVREVVVANRTLERAVALARRFNGRSVSLDEMVEQLELVDIIISSTGAPDIILSKKEVAPLMRRRRNRPLFFIDIAVPRDLDPAINDLDNVYLYDIDDLTHVVELNKSERDREAAKAQRIVAEETIKFSQWLDNMELTPTIVDLRRMGEAICETELEKTLKRLDISDRDHKAIRKMAAAIVGKMLHHPLAYLKSDTPCQDKGKRIITIRTVFQLDAEERKS